MTHILTRMALGSALMCLAATAASAQQPTTTQQTKAFEVIAVDGDKLVVKLPEGTREITVPPGFQFNIDGTMMSVGQLKPGMRGTATITTTTTQVPVTVTEVRNGTVLQATRDSVTVRTDEGVKQFTQSDLDKRGITIMRAGKPARLSDLRENDQLTATIITAKPPQIVTEQEVQATLARGRAATPSPSSTPASGTPRAAAATGTAGATAPQTQLPATGSWVPLLGLTGLGSLVVGLALTARRRRRAL